MSTEVFHPPEDHLGSIKSQYGSTNLAKHVGFTDSYEAVYSKGTALVEALAVSYEDTYSWRSASFFTGVDLNIADYLTPAREVVSVVLAALDLISNVLTVLDTLLLRGVNILKAIVDKVLELLLEVLSLLNPTISCHMLVIPPKIGKIEAKYPEIEETDSSVVKSAKKSEQARQDFSRYINSLHNRLPQFLASDLTKLKEVSSRNITGYNYLLDTIETKLRDKTDAGRPALKAYSRWDGVGIFIGSSAVNQVLNSWEAINSLFSKELGLEKLKFKGLPSKPIIVENQIPKLNNIAIPGIVDSDDSHVTSLAVVVRPIVPNSHTIKSGVTFYFRRRLICVIEIGKATDTPSIIKKAIDSELSEEPLIQAALLANDIPVTNLTAYTYLDISAQGDPEYLRVPGVTNKLPDAEYYLTAIDFYAIDRLADLPDPSNKHIYLVSDFQKFSCKSDKHTLTAQGVFSWRLPLSNPLDSSSLTPSWLAASTAVQFLPEVITSVEAFLTTLFKSLEALLDDALDWIKVLLTNLQTIIEAYQLILGRIDAIIQLLQELINVTSSIGASVIRFSGEGTDGNLIKVFQEYLDPNISSSAKVSGTPSELDIRRSTILAEEDRLRSWAESSKSQAVANLIVRDDPSPYDATGSVKLVADDRAALQRSELENLLSEGSNVRDAAASVAYRSSYNMSPVFTNEMTTAGLVLIGHDSSYSGLHAWRTLLDLLFGSEEYPSEGNQRTLLEAAGLQVDLPNLDPQVITEAPATPATIFTANMELTEQPNNSPFNFCPSDE